MPAPKIPPKSLWNPTRTARDHVVQRRHDEAADVTEEVDHSGSLSRGRARVACGEDCAVRVEPGRSRRRPRGGSGPGGVRRASCRGAAVHGDRLERVGRAGRVVAADLAVERADQRAVEHAGGRSAGTSRRHPGADNGARSASQFRVRRGRDDAGSARTTSTAEPGSPASAGRCSRARCRSRRFTRLRTTALPTALLTTKPTSGRLAGVGCSLEVDHDSAGPAATTRRTARRKASLSREPVRRGQHARGRRRRSRQTARLLRPLRRREDRMERPARVRMRRRKPCILCRRRLFGWNVRLLTSVLSDAVSLGVSTPLAGWCVRRTEWSPHLASAGTAHPRACTQLGHGVVDMRHRSTPE